MVEFNKILESHVKQEIELHFSKEEANFMRDSFANKGAEIAIKMMGDLLDDYFKLLWRLKGMKIHIGKNKEDLEHILSDYIPKLSELHLLNLYNCLKVNSETFLQVEKYYGDLKEG